MKNGLQERNGIAKSKLRLAIPLFSILWVAGCAVGPDYRRPPLDAPAGFRGETQFSTNSFADLPWWQVFHDDALQRLIRTALTNNYDLRIAVTRVAQARALADQARAGFFPQLNYTGIVGSGKNVTGVNAPSPTGVSGSLFGADVNAAWEIDLWGRIRRLNESALAQYLSTQEARRDVTISLIAQVVQDYYQLLALDREIQIARDTTNAFASSLKIFDQRLRGGVASKLESSSAEALMDSAAATIPDLERQIVIQENQLSVLLGENPGVIIRTESTLEKQMLPQIPPGLPSALIERRPDIREAEQQLRSANAQLGVAEADFYPRLNLTGLLGKISPELSTLTAGGANAWSAAASLTGPIFQGGFLTARVRQAMAARKQFVLQYQYTVLLALQEVSNALIAREKLAIARDEQTKAVAAYEQAVKTATQRYRLGNASYYEVLQEQQLLYPAQNTLVQTQLNQLLSVVQLYRALGGGWQQSQ